MKKIISTVLGILFAFTLTATVANSAAKEVRVAYFLEWPSPNLEDMNKKAYAKALGVPVKWTNFTNGVACLLYTSPSPRDRSLSRMPSSA